MVVLNLILCKVVGSSPPGDLIVMVTVRSWGPGSCSDGSAIFQESAGVMAVIDSDLAGQGKATAKMGKRGYRYVKLKQDALP